jgi:hypothetical protein
LIDHQLVLVELLLSQLRDYFSSQRNFKPVSEAIQSNECGTERRETVLHEGLPNFTHGKWSSQQREKRMDASPHVSTPHGQIASHPRRMSIKDVKSIIRNPFPKDLPTAAQPMGLFA